MKIKGTLPTPDTSKYHSVLEEMLDNSKKLLEACNQLKQDAVSSAEDEDAMARAKAKSFLLAEGKNKETREANADAGWAEARLKAFKSKANANAQLELVRSLRQILSALQTYANSSKAEADAIHYGQSE